MKLGHWPKCQKLHIYSRSTQGVETEPIFDQRAAVSEILADFPRYGPIFKIAIFGQETWPSAKVREIVYILSKLPPSPKFHSVLLCGWPFPRY